jgi:hypothetical protein
VVLVVDWVVTAVLEPVDVTDVVPLEVCVDDLVEVPVLETDVNAVVVCEELIVEVSLLVPVDEMLVEAVDDAVLDTVVLPELVAVVDFVDVTELVAVVVTVVMEQPNRSPA